MHIDKFEQQDKAKQNAIVAAGVAEFAQKAYSDASTDVIVQACGISKGLLFHYFGSKKEFYCYCLAQSLERLVEPTDKPQGSFYEILFAVMNQKLKLCARYPAETRFVNMASREAAREVATDKAKLFSSYAARTHSASAAIMAQALATLSIKVENPEKAKEGLLLYSNAIISKYLLTYQNTPDTFFENAQQLQAEIKVFLDFMLYGIAEEDIQ